MNEEALLTDSLPALTSPSPVKPIVLPEAAAHNYYDLAELFMDASRKILEFFHLEGHKELLVFVYAVLVFVVAFGIGLILQWIIVKILHSLSKKLNNDIYNSLVQNKFFTRFCRIIPAILFLILIQYTLASHATLALWLTRLTTIYIVILVAIALCSVVDAAWVHINNRENKRKLPLKGIATLFKGIIWIIALMIIVALLVNKSPASLLAGLGAFAAVLMLIFKDTILGVVAGVQLSETDSLHVGDWIKVGDANGIVEEVTLTQVKILNWDLTTTTVPPYSLISTGFTNYRSMQQSETRRVERSYLIDADSVTETTDEMLDEFAKIPILTDWITKKRSQKAAGKVENVFNSAGLVDGSIETNLGVFRAYLTLYLHSHPHVFNGQGPVYAQFITTLPQTSAGIPLQLYFFTSTSSWVPYEHISASIFEHIAIMLKTFKLYTFEYPSGRDTIIEGYMNPGKAPESVLGIPQGLFNPKPQNEQSMPGSQAPPVTPNPDINL